MANEKETLLKVDHLCQYFGPTKAVDDVSFEIKKGEVFGLVGESGCGKTTTGRSIIKIYDITSGSIYFKGQRICAGVKSYKDEIKFTKASIRKLKKSGDADASEKIAKANEHIAQLKTEIDSAKFDHNHSDREYAKKQMAKTKAEFEPKLEAAKDNPEKLAQLKKQYKDQLHIDKNTRLITQIQMIFQDPIASLNPV